MVERLGLAVAGERRLDPAAGMEDEALVAAQIRHAVGGAETVREIEAVGESLVGGGKLAQLPEGEPEVVPGHHLALGPAERLPARDGLAIEIYSRALPSQPMGDLGEAGDRLRLSRTVPRGLELAARLLEGREDLVEAALGLAVQDRAGLGHRGDGGDPSEIGGRLAPELVQADRAPAGADAFPLGADLDLEDARDGGTNENHLGPPTIQWGVDGGGLGTVRAADAGNEVDSPQLDGDQIGLAGRELGREEAGFAGGEGALQRRGGSELRRVRRRERALAGGGQREERDEMRP